MNTLLRRYEQTETDEHGECLVELTAIGWELYSITVNGYEEKRVVGIDRALNQLEEYYNPDSDDWIRTV